MVPTLLPSLTKCVTLGKLINFPILTFLSWETEKTPSRVVIKNVSQVLALFPCSVVMEAIAGRTPCTCSINHVIIITEALWKALDPRSESFCVRQEGSVGLRVVEVVGPRQRSLHYLT